MHNRRTLHALTIAAVLASAIAVSDGAASDCEPSPVAVCSHCGEKVCVAFVSPVTHTESCCDAKCDKVCVPAMRFPWHRGKKAECCDCAAEPRPGCGMFRGARKLKEVVSNCDACRSEQRVVCCCPKCGPVPHGECGSVPLAETPAEMHAQAVEPTESTKSVAATEAPSAFQETELAADAASPQPQPKPRWSDRLRSRVVSWKESFGPQPRAAEGDLSRLIGHSRFGAEQPE
jgi:hypothetical protein